MLSPETFIVRLSVERDGAQLCSTFVVSAASASRPTGPRESRLRRDAAALGGAQRPRRGCGVFAVERRRSGRQEQRWPGASK